MLAQPFRQPAGTAWSWRAGATGRPCATRFVRGLSANASPRAGGSPGVIPSRFPGAQEQRLSSRLADNAVRLPELTSRLPEGRLRGPTPSIICLVR